MAMPPLLVLLLILFASALSLAATLYLIGVVRMNQAELAQALADIKTQADKAKAEIVAAVQALTDALAAAGSTTPEVDAALAALQASVQGLDDLNPDV